MTTLLDGEDSRFTPGTKVMNAAGDIAEVIATNFFDGVGICVLKNNEQGVFEVAENSLLELW